ncbi:SDR family oxidoreductase [Antrihabitans cavernicola]|uniref:SDR family oxidoreductase n=1 Tax=Antrihabitans cavernicola TaxID=2495913 RepID=A0A5A7SFD7_9NOCA|nr:SDR family oxidoreductase [Spelaeibacter cavernicola]KAA0024840.1 SDR family oxidoreductase [Spelaeibacter cavernicola]
MNAPLQGRTAVITGAASGMGAATALHLATQGARVALLSRRQDRLDDLAAQIRAAGGEAMVLAVDIADADAVTAAADRIDAAWGPIDTVINAAGVMLAAPIDDSRSDQWARMIDTNLSGTLHVIRAFTPALLRAAEKGTTVDIVNVSSIAAHFAFPNYAVYSATKAAVTHLSNALRSEFGRRGVRVTNVEPGLTDTELGTHLDEERRTELGYMFDAIAALSAEDIADLIGYVVTRSPNVNLRQVIVLPTQQA